MRTEFSKHYWPIFTLNSNVQERSYLNPRRAEHSVDLLFRTKYLNLFLILSDAKISPTTLLSVPCIFRQQGKSRLFENEVFKQTFWLVIMVSVFANKLFILNSPKENNCTINVMCVVLINLVFLYSTTYNSLHIQMQIRGVKLEHVSAVQLSSLIFMSIQYRSTDIYFGSHSSCSIVHFL